MTNTYFSGRLKGNVHNVQTATTNATLTTDDEIILADATSGAVTLTLPAAANATNKCFHIKKIDSSRNAVIIDGASSELVDDATTQAIIRQYDALTIASNGTAWYVINADPYQPKLLCRTAVSFATSVVTPLVTAPSGKAIKITDIVIECTTAQTGGTSSTLKIGTSGGSYAELLNGATGMVQTTATATTLLQLGDRLRPTDRWPYTSVQGTPTGSFTSTISASLTKSGSTAGGCIVELHGYLV